jgi:hypothetical protein
MGEISLATAIQALRAQLKEALDDGAGDPLRLEVNSIVLELEVVLSASGQAEAKAGLWTVLTAGVSADHSRASTHRLTLSLAPRLEGDPPGQKLAVNDQVTGPPSAVTGPR